jgi:hypothetical protein
MNFFYQIGPVVTNLPWTKPNFYSVKSIFEYLDKETNLYSRYKIYIYGNVLNTWNTNDLDIWLNPIDDYNYSNLDNDMCLLANICLNQFRILPDIQFTELTPVSIIKCFKNKNYLYYKSEEDVKFLSRVKFKYIKKKSQLDDFEIVLGGLEVSKNLIKFECNRNKEIKEGNISGKFIFKIDSSKNYKNHEEVVYYLDSREIIGSSIEDFDKKTNRFNI